MSMQIKPVLAALRKHRVAAFLIGMEIALACAILCNALFLVVNRVGMMRLDSGVDEDRLVVLSLSGIEPSAALDTATRLKAAFAGIAGVDAVGVGNSVPFVRPAGEAGFRLRADDPHYRQEGHFYVGDADYVRALGLHIVAGRGFRPDEYAAVGDYLPAAHVLLVDADYARRLWPGQNPLGKMVYPGGTEGGFRVIGLYARLARPDPSPGTVENTFLTPGLAGKGMAGVYVLRTSPGQRVRVLDEARKRVASLAPGAVVDPDDTGTFGDLRHAFFATDRATAGLLVGVIAALMLVTALGIVGLASFWVGQRRKQIGVRRALGATRRDILHYFQMENFLIVGFGIAIGMVLAYGMSLAIMQRYALPHLPWSYLPAGAVALWLLGQLAVLAPALRAAAVPPVVATRTV